jgi:SAM-dependent methyltransferase
MRQSSQTIRACYDAVAAEYAEKFCGELAHKPLDRALLQAFAEEARGRGVVYDLGCGPGQTTAFLHACGAEVHGVDLSPELLRSARERHPAVPFQEGDMLALPLEDASAAGIVAFYAIVHFDADQLARALGEMRRVLRPGGRLLLAFHVGEERLRVEDFLGRPVALEFVFWPVEQVEAALRAAGFTDIETRVREPYPGVEYPSRRAYVLARAASSLPGQ